MNIANQKTTLRKHYREMRSRLSAGQRAEREQAICSQLLNLVSSFEVKTIASYRAFGSEVNLEDFHQNVSAQLVFPRVGPQYLEFYLWSPDDDLEISGWGVEEPLPKSENRVSLADVDVVVVPGLVFDHHCQRLGYGKGHYDRALSSWNGLSVGVGFQLQVSKEKLETEVHDLPMNYLVTEEYILRPLTH